MRKITLIIMILSIAFSMTAISYAKDAQHTARMYPTVKEGWRLTDSTVSGTYFHGNSWEYDCKFVYEYSSDFPQKPNRIQYVLYDYDGDFGWYLLDDYQISYDAEGRLLLIANPPFPLEYSECYYDDEGRLIQVDDSNYQEFRTWTISYDESEVWVHDNSRNQYIFTVNENWEIITKKWLSLDHFDEWREHCTEEYQYHPQNNSSFREFQDWLAYLLANKHQRELEVPGLCMQKLEGSYFDDSFLYYNKTIWDYDDALKALKRKRYQLADFDWDLYHESEYEYDAEGLLSLETHKRKFDDDDELTNFQKIEHRYETYVSIEDENQSPALALEISLWPMPFRENVNIRIESKDSHQTSLEIYNLKGQLICKPSLVGKNQITWDGKDARGRDLPNGVYFLKAISGKDVATKKMIKVK